MNFNKKSNIDGLIFFVLAILVYIIDIIKPFNISGLFFYGIPILFIFWRANEHRIIHSAFVFSLTILLGFYLSPINIFSKSDLTFRFIELITLWIAVFVVFYREQRHQFLFGNKDTLQRITEHTTDLICELDLEGNYLYASPSHKKILGFSPEELIGTNAFELVHPDDIPNLMEIRNRIISSGKFERVEYRMRHKHNGYIWVETDGKLLCQDGKPDREILNIRDITARKRMENRMQEVEEQLKTVTQTIPAAIFIYEGTRFRYINKFAEVLTGYTQEELLKMNFWDVVHPDFKEIVMKRGLARQRGEELPTRYEFKIIRKNGEERWLDFTAGILRYNHSSAILGTAFDITERKKMEEELRTSEERYRNIVNLSPDAIVVYIGGKIVFANAASAELIGARSPEELLGMAVLDFVHPSYKEAVKQRTRQMLEKNINMPLFEEKFIKLDGTVIDVEVVASPFPYEGKSAIFVMVRDITQKKQIERTLSQQEAYFKQLFESSPQAIVLLDSEDRIVDVNKGFERLFQYKLEEIKGEFINDVILTPEFEPEATAYSNTVLKGNIVQGESVRKRKDGTLVEVSLLGFPVQIQNQNIGVFGIYSDITDRKGAQESLQRLQRAVEQSDNVIMMTDVDGNITYVNPSFERVYGYSKEEIIGENARILKSGEMSDEFYNDFWKTVLSGRSLRAEFINKTKDNRKVIVESSVNPVIDTSGKVNGFIAVQLDITERKRIETDIRQLQKMESLGTLAGGIAHDFNNILGIILGFSELLPESKSDPQKFSRHLEAIQKATQRGSNLVRQILTFARKSDISFQQVNINSLIDDLVKMLEATFPRTIEISLQLDRSIQPINGDTTQLNQAFLNLCVNARDAMPQGGVLSLSTSISSREELSHRLFDPEFSRYIHIKVADSGLGMDEETRSRIFEPFFTTKGEGRGTGLGLAVVFGVVASHKGYITVDSQIGIGTDFHIYLPYETAEGDTETSADKPREASKGGNETILIVEDEESLREMLILTLEAKGYSVIAANDGLEAIELYNRNKHLIDVVVSDVGLPRLSGEKVLQRLKKINPAVKVILASGYLEQTQRFEAIEYGAKYILQKPYSPDEVLTTIRKIIDEQ